MPLLIEQAHSPAELSLESFREHFVEEKPAYEYWFGEAVQKLMPTRKHAILQLVLAMALLKVGYRSRSELTLRIDPEWEPVPDVVGEAGADTGDYPTAPVAVVMEILSPADRVSRILVKCQNYSRLGIPGIFVFDPEERLAWQWLHPGLAPVTQIELPNGNQIELAEVWSEFEKLM